VTYLIPLKLQIILIAISLLATAQLIRMIVRYKLELKYALLWILMSITSLCLAIFPIILFQIAEILNVETPTNALFLMAILLILAIIFSLTIALSRASNKIKNLSQELGILKCEIEALRINNKKEE